MKTISNMAVAAMVAMLPRSTSAALASYCNGDNNDICYSWGVPESTASSGSGNIFFRIEAPTDYQWVALGTGSRMSGSTMFVIYQDGSGNVTLSTREGHGHTMPEYSRMGAVKMLEGSGVANRTMVANIQGGDLSGIDFAASNDWISAWKTGSPLDSTDVRANIDEHDGTDSFSVDFSKATIGSDSNPFTNGSNTRPNTGGAVTGGGGGEDHAATIHGIIMSIVFLIGFPVGSFLMPVLGKWLIHAGWQIFAFAGMWVGFGLGKIAADRDGEWFSEPHVQLGTVVCVLMILQPILGWMHHRNYVKYQRRTLISYGHLWYGRALMIIGIANGGVGLQLAEASTGFVAAYAVVGVVIFSIYTAGAIYKERKLRRREGLEEANAALKAFGKNVGA
ncbi:hypothetical protein ACJ41O_012670 [Fusarium nematophilum]